MGDLSSYLTLTHFDGAKFRGLCNRHGDRRASLFLTLNGDRLGTVHCSVCDLGRDKQDPERTFNFLKEAGLLSDLLEHVKTWDGGVSYREYTEKPPEVPEPWTFSQQWWDWGQPIKGTPAELYLNGRGIFFDPWPDCLRYFAHPIIKDSDSFAALFVNPFTNEPKAVLHTWITWTRRGWIKDRTNRVFWGQRKDAVCKLAPNTDKLAIGEGVETMLSAMQLGITPAWACGPADNIASFPLMDGKLIICADHDDAGLKAAKLCKERWKKRARIISPDVDGYDYNDVVRKANGK